MIAAQICQVDRFARLSKQPLNCKIKSHFNMNLIDTPLYYLSIALMALHVLYFCAGVCTSACLCLGQEGGPKKNICTRFIHVHVMLLDLSAV